MKARLNSIFNGSFYYEVGRQDVESIELIGKNVFINFTSGPSIKIPYIYCQNESGVTWVNN